MIKLENKYLEEKIFNKTLEEGLFNNLQNASLYQLNQLLSFKWHYYTTEYANKLINAEILQKTRQNKFKRILE
jgi:hypothetical protein